MAILWAILTALFFSCGQFLVSRAIRFTNASTAAWFTSGQTGLFLWAIAFFQPLPALTPGLVGVFAAAAFFSPFLARIALYRGYATLGYSRPTVASSTSALFAVLLAFLFLGEPMTLWMGVGTVGAVLGVGLLAYEKLPRTSWKKIHLIYPLFAAFCFGARDAVARYGVKGFPSAVVAAAITTTIAWLMLSHLFFLKGSPFRFHIEASGLLPLLSAGFFYVMAYYALFATLSAEYLVVTAPAIHSSPFFTLILSYLFIRREERISPRLVLGAFFVVLGVTVVTLARRGL